MRSNRKVVTSLKRTVNTYAYIQGTSKWLLKKGKEEYKGSYYLFMASLTFSAFTLEAYLNHIGEKIFKTWKDLECLSHQAKLNIIAECLKIKIERGKRPGQTVNKLFKFRNAIAHGKSVRLKYEETIPIDKYSDTQISEMIPTKWEKYCTCKNAEKAIEDVESIVQTIHNAAKQAGIQDDEPFVRGFQSGSTTVIEE